MASTTTMDQDLKSLKAPKPPEKPLTPYMRFSRKVWDDVKAAHADRKLWEIGKLIGTMWKELPSSQKQKFQAEYDIDKVGYTDALKIYRNSPKYLQYLAAKEKLQLQDENEKVRNKILKRDAGKKVIVAACDEDDGYSRIFSARHLSAARFQRNSRLLLELFSEAIVPDPRSVVTTTRIKTMKRQMQSLNSHRQKLEQEMQQIEDTFQSKKAHLLESGTQFSQTMEKLSSLPIVNDGIYQQMVSQATQQLLAQYSVFSQQQQQQAWQQQSHFRGNLSEPSICYATIGGPPVSSTPTYSNVIFSSDDLMNISEPTQSVAMSGISSSANGMTVDGSQFAFASNLC